LRVAASDAERDKVVELYKLYGPAIRRRCLRLLGDKEAGNDATQEVFIRLLGNVAKLETREMAIRWMYRVSVNHCLHLIRNRLRRSCEPMTAAAEPRTSGAIDFVADRQLAQKVLSRFDARTRGVVVGVYVGGMEHAEVGKLLGISRTSVQRTLRRFSINSRKYLHRTHELEAEADPGSAAGPVRRSG